MLNDPIDAFSPDYETARRRFRHAAQQVGLLLESHPIEPAVAGTSRLTIDVARPAAVSTRGAVILSSGLHGIEGFLGSAVQLSLLEALSSRALNAGHTALVLIHALNPYGFAHLRRVNEDNVDPNRNFLLAGEDYAGSPSGYDQVASLLNPKHPPSLADRLVFYPRAYQFVRRFGIRAMKRIVAQGQYDHPQGLFYGGGAPTRTFDVVSHNMPRWLEGSSQILHLDLHSGLGKWADYKLLLDWPISFGRLESLRRHFGSDRVEPADAEATAYQLKGGLGRWCTSTYAACHYTYTCVEFGTYSPIKVLAALRAENQAHHWSAPSSPAVKRSKHVLRERFCPRSRSWRRAVIEQSIRVVQRSFDFVETA